MKQQETRGISTKKIVLLLIVIGLPVASYSIYSWLIPANVSGQSWIFSPTLPSPSEKVVCITFDDGWLSQLDVLPVLDTYNFKATFGIVTSYIDKGFDGYLSWEQILSLQSLGHDIESHSTNHSHMNNLSLSQLMLEVAGSYDAFTKHNITPRIFIYPFGEGATNETVRAIVSTYYLCARDTSRNRVDLTSVDPYAISAFGIYNSTSLDTFKSYVENIQGSTVTLLYYHKIGDPTTDKYIISLEQFNQQMAYLKDNGYTVKTMRELFLKPNNQEAKTIT